METDRSGREGAWIGVLAIGPSFALYVGPLGETSTHRHHAFQLIVAAGGVVRLVLGEETERDFRAVAVQPDASHRIASTCEHAWVLYVDPAAPSGRSLRSFDDRAGWWVPRASSAFHPGEFPHNWEQTVDFVDQLLRMFHVEPVENLPSRPDVLAHLVELLPREIAVGRGSLPATASAIGISPSRLRHIVRDETGLSWRPFLRWVRVKAAATAIAEGATLTDAAHQAGFADSAHFSRSFRAMFGITPSLAMGALRWIVPTS